MVTMVFYDILENMQICKYATNLTNVYMHHLIAEKPVQFVH